MSKVKLQLVTLIICGPGLLTGLVMGIIYGIEPLYLGCAAGMAAGFAGLIKKIPLWGVAVAGGAAPLITAGLVSLAGCGPSLPMDPECALEAMQECYEAVNGCMEDDASTDPASE